MPANYNNSAWFYDRLSRLVYGMAMIDSQRFLLTFIPSGSKVLIVGGGTGRVLEEIARSHAEGLEITYVEIAARMMAVSQTRNTGNNAIVFINNAIENVCLQTDFDVVITPFFFDSFTQRNFERLFGHIDSALKPGGLWLNCDFQLAGKWWQSILLKTMYLFFRVICNIEALRLPAIQKEFELRGYKKLTRKAFYGNFILSEVYSRA